MLKKKQILEELNTKQTLLGIRDIRVTGQSVSKRIDVE